MKEAAIRKRLLELCEAITASPLSDSSSADVSGGVYRPGAPSKTVDLEEQLDHLRLQVKYVLFDLEATRRENHYLRQMLETRPPRRGRDEETGSGPAPQ